MADDVTAKGCDNDEKTEEVKEFFDHWQVYQKILDNNYAHHREISAAFLDFLVLRYNKPFTLLDFGCGDAGFMTSVLGHTLISHYQGVDLSGVALTLAERHLECLDCEKTFIMSDFFTVVEHEDTIADLIWTGLSFHHLSEGQKDHFIGQCRRVLDPGGCFMIFDPVMKDDENREGFLRRWWDVCRTRWNALSPGEKEATRVHVFDNDYPESMDVFKRMGERHGFSHVHSLYCDEDDIYRLICLER